MLMLIPLVAAQILALAPESKVWIEGDSSLHPWSCKATNPVARIEVDPGSAQIAQSLTLRVQVAGLDCGDNKMNEKLREALKFEQHPTIDYRLTRAERLSSKPLKLKASGELTIAGRTLTADFTVDVEMSPDGTEHARGQVDLLMTDFGVEPPTAFLILKTHDEVTVHFDIRTAPRGLAHASPERRAP
jgi:polyisoprenoid-binding protein YceI